MIKWMCVGKQQQCKSLLGILSDDGVLTIKRKDLYIYIDFKNRKIRSICTKCGQENETSFLKGEN